ncbi:MAG: aminotransferase class V-fold PLP-dependent enzyme [Rubripirellula sp.]
MSDHPRIYLDHAATSWPKSDAVLDAMDRFARECGAAAGRGGYQSAAQADQVIALTRRTLGRLIHAESPDCISFHCNGTAALNAAIHGVVAPGDHVVTTAADHNSVLRPLHYLAQHHDLQLTVVPATSGGRVDPAQLLGAVTDETRLVVMTHASNVTGTVQAINEVGQGLKQHDAMFLCDAAQTFGVVPLDVKACCIDLLAAPGHKSSGGPLGTAFLYVSEGSHERLRPTIQGGTGSRSESLEMPTKMPSMLEAGNLNVPAIAGWLVALMELQETGVEARYQLAKTLAEQLHHGLASIEGLQVYGEPSDLPIASVNLDGVSPADAAVILDAEFGIETRAGLHCAALIHSCLGSSSDGTLRISAGHTTTAADIDAVVAALGMITQELK